MTKRNKKAQYRAKKDEKQQQRMATIKKFTCIAKVSNERFVRYHVNDLLLFTRFLDRQFRGWRWFNVYSYDKLRNREQVASFTNRNRPTKRHINI